VSVKLDIGAAALSTKVGFHVAVEVPEHFFRYFVTVKRLSAAAMKGYVKFTFQEFL